MVLVWVSGDPVFLTASEARQLLVDDSRLPPKPWPQYYQGRPRLMRRELKLYRLLQKTLLQMRSEDPTKFKSLAIRDAKGSMAAGMLEFLIRGTWAAGGKVGCESNMRTPYCGDSFDLLFCDPRHWALRWIQEPTEKVHGQILIQRRDVLSVRGAPHDFEAQLRWGTVTCVAGQALVSLY